MCIYIYLYVNSVMLLPVGLSSKLGVILERCYPARMLTGGIPGGKRVCGVSSS